MKNTNVIQVLKTLSKKEIKEFGKYLKSIYREDGGIYLLYEYLKKCHPNFVDKNIERVFIEKKIFPNSVNSQRTLFDATSLLLKALKEFLVKKRLEKNSIARDFLFLEELKERRLDNLFFQEIEKTESRWNEEKNAGIEYLHDVFKLNMMRLLHPSWNVIDKKNVDSVDLIELLDTYYIASKLYWTLCNHTTNSFANNTTNEKQYFVDDVIKFASLSEFQQKPQIRILSQLTNAFLYDKLGNYQTIKKDFLGHLNIYNEYEKNDFLNFFIILNNKIGTADAFRELFELYDFYVQEKLILEDGTISFGSFLNIVNLGCRASRLNITNLEWVENFIATYKDALKAGSQKEATISYGEVIIAMNKKDYAKALENLREVNLKNAFYGVQIRCYLLQCYYELGGYENSFEDLIKSFKKFLKDNQTPSSDFKIKFGKFIFYITKINNIKNAITLRATKNKDLNLKKLLEELKKEKSVAYKSWLSQKIKEL